MGEISEKFLDGTLCECCGETMDGEAAGYPRRCAGCGGDQDDVGQVERPHKGKTRCPQCGRSVKVTGLHDHLRDAHGMKSA